MVIIPFDISIISTFISMIIYVAITITVKIVNIASKLVLKCFSFHFRIIINAFSTIISIHSISYYFCIYFILNLDDPCTVFVFYHNSYREEHRNHLFNNKHCFFTAMFFVSSFHYEFD